MKTENCGVIWLFKRGSYCMLKISHGHGCIYLKKFSLLALVVTGLLQSQDKMFWSVCIDIAGVVLVIQCETLQARTLSLSETLCWKLILYNWSHLTKADFLPCLTGLVPYPWKRSVKVSHSSLGKVCQECFTFQHRKVSKFAIMILSIF